MMQNKNLASRVAVGILATLALLIPPLLTALVWTPLNLLITLGLFSLSVLAAFKYSKAKWVLAAITSAAIALPPYPNWIWWSESRGWHFWVGPNLRQMEIGANAVFFLIALLIYAALFWAIGRRSSKVTVQK